MCEEKGWGLKEFKDEGPWRGTKQGALGESREGEYCT